MTDNEIIKALESLLDRMRAYEAQQASIGKGLVEDIISMYDHQKAEIERLQGLLKEWKKAGYKYADSIDLIRAEAVNEFWSKLKEFCDTSIYFDSSSDERDFKTFGDNLLKEMGGAE